jgi:hypothetical protein
MRNFLTVAFLLTCLVSVFAQEITDPKVTEVWDPEPKIVTPGTNGSAPSDAIVLFDGKNLDSWVDKDGKNAKWNVQDGFVVVAKGTGDIKTKQAFGDIQLHIEFRTPAKVEGESQGRGNSGIFFQERYELQVLDSYKNRTYANGQAGSIYKQTPPLVNPTKGPGEWQVYVVVYIAPKYNEDGTIKSKGRITAFLNGVLVQNNTEIQGTTEYIGRPKVVAHGKASLKLQDHNNPTAFRNIWVREL